MRKILLFFQCAIVAFELSGQASANQILEERIIPWDVSSGLQLRSFLLRADDLIELGFHRMYGYIAMYQIIQSNDNGPDLVLCEVPFSAVRIKIRFLESDDHQTDIYANTKELMEYFFIPHENLSYFPPEEAGSYRYIEEVPYQSLDAVAYLSLFTHRVPQLEVSSGPEALSGFYPSVPAWWNYEYATPFLNEKIDTSTGKRQTWFGEFNDAMFPLVEHQDHGLIKIEYTRDKGTLHLWWQDTTLGRCYTREEIYPYIYSERDDEWFYYYLGSSNPRWFYSLKYNEWLAHP